MDISLTLRFRTPDFPLFHFQNHHQPMITRPSRKRNPTFPLQRTSHLMVTAKKQTVIEGVSEELNSIASQSLDFAPARRRVRSAFTEVQQQLDHCLFMLSPKEIKTEEWYERNSRGLEIFCKSWMPEQGVRIKGVLCFCHGYGDTCTFFFEGIAKIIAASGYAVYALDYPGFGLSEGLHGYIPRFEDLADVVIEQYTKIKDMTEWLFMVLLWHDDCRQTRTERVALLYLRAVYGWSCYSQRSSEATASMGWNNPCSPNVQKGLTPPAAVLKGLTLLSKVLPKAKLFSQKDLAELAFRDPRKRKMAAYNVICYNDQMRLKTAVELLKATKYIETQVEKVSSPLLILHGAADKVTDPLVSQFLYEKASSKDKTLKLYEGGYHSILEGEPDDRIFTVLDDIIAWLDSRCSIE